MGTYVVLLRGVMPYGRNKVPMATLRTVLSEAGLGNVQTYIQTGNIVARSELSRAEIETLVRDAVRERIGAPVSAIARTAEQFKVIRIPSPMSTVQGSTSHFFTSIRAESVERGSCSPTFHLMP